MHWTHENPILGTASYVVQIFDFLCTAVYMVCILDSTQYDEN